MFTRTHAIITRTHCFGRETWSYVKEPQAEFAKLQPIELADLVLTFGSSS
jgi:hypothetical protein